MPASVGVPEAARFLREAIRLAKDETEAPMTTSHAAVMESPGRIVLREFNVPDPEPGVVVIAMHLSGICGTDKHTFRGESKQYAGTAHERDIEYPLICGHENVGTVVASGGPVFDTTGSPSRRATVSCREPTSRAGRATSASTATRTTSAEHLEDYGNSLNCSRSPSLFGGWSQYMYLLPRTPIFRVPDELPDEVAVITEVMAVTHGVDKGIAVLGLQGGSRSGFSVAVLGTGPLGLCHLIKSRMLGAGTVVATDVLAGRLQFADQFGVDLALDAERHRRRPADGRNSRCDPRAGC